MDSPTFGRVGVVLIAHGTRDPRGAEEMSVLVEHTQQRLGVPVAAGWLEDFVSPDAATAAETIVDQCDVIVTIPVLNFAAGHAKNDVPEAVAAVRDAVAPVPVFHGSVLGIDPALLRLGWDRIDQVSDPSNREDEVLIVAASGSSDPDANGELAKAARMLAEGTGHRWVEVCVAGVTWPKIGTVLDRVYAAGARRITVFSWSLLAGVLEKRIWTATDDFDEAHPDVTVFRADRFGPDPLIAEAITHRVDEALLGDPRSNCDLCVYRVPFPGKEERLGTPSAGGTAAS